MFFGEQTCPECLTMLTSLRQMKEMKHENLVQFFGVCVEPPNVCLVTQYCKKGSLKVSPPPRSTARDTNSHPKTPWTE